MKRSTVLLIVGLAVALFVAAWATVRMVKADLVAAPRATAVANAARTSLPGMAPASGEPILPSLTALHPKPGTLIQASGPFDERFTLSALSFDGKAAHATATITSDVSDLLEFGAVAGFYDASGALLGVGRFTHHLDESTVSHAPGVKPNEATAFTIDVPANLKGRAVSAAVGVPVLVNE